MLCPPKLKEIVLAADGGLGSMAGTRGGVLAGALTAPTEGRIDMCVPFALVDAPAGSLFRFSTFEEEPLAPLAFKKLSRVSKAGIACGEWVAGTLELTVWDKSTGRLVAGKADVKSSARPCRIACLIQRRKRIEPTTSFWAKPCI
jgi:hypothetical protein